MPDSYSQVVEAGIAMSYFHKGLSSVSEDWCIFLDVLTSLFLKETGYFYK